jgi:hypothetical protein
LLVELYSPGLEMIVSENVGQQEPSQSVPRIDQFLHSLDALNVALSGAVHPCGRQAQ